MTTLTTHDGVEIFYKDWGPKDAQPIVFHHGWPLTADDWDAQMLYFLYKGYRVIAHDRRGHGRSTQVSEGHDMDHYAADTSAVVEHLDLENAVHVGHSTGGGQATRYVARYGQPQGRVAKLVLIDAVTPIMVKTAANPGGLPIETFDGLRQQLAANRSQFYIDLPTGPFYSFNRPGARDARRRRPDRADRGFRAPLGRAAPEQYAEDLSEVPARHVHDARGAREPRPADLHRAVRIETEPSYRQPLRIRSKPMKIVVIGGTGLIGSKASVLLRGAGHDALAAAPTTGVDTSTGEGLEAALDAADVVVDLANSPSFEPSAVMAFFAVHEKNLLAAEARAGVRHHVALSIVGADRSPANGYFRAKIVQEDLIKASGIPYTIIRSTQFMEFLGAIADAGQGDGVVNVATGLFQPIAADDVAAVVAEVATAAPRGGTIEIAGPERAPFDEIIRRYLEMTGDERPVHADPEARYFGARVERFSLVPTGSAQLGEITLADWVKRKLATGAS